MGTPGSWETGKFRESQLGFWILTRLPTGSPSTAAGSRAVFTWEKLGREVFTLQIQGKTSGFPPPSSPQKRRSRLGTRAALSAPAAPGRELQGLGIGGPALRGPCAGVRITRKNASSRAAPCPGRPWAWPGCPNPLPHCIRDPLGLGSLVPVVGGAPRHAARDAPPAELP